MARTKQTTRKVHAHIAATNAASVRHANVNAIVDVHIRDRILLEIQTLATVGAASKISKISCGKLRRKLLQLGIDYAKYRSFITKSIIDLDY